MIRFTIPATPPSSLSQNARINRWDRTRIKGSWMMATLSGLVTGVTEEIDPSKRYVIDVAVFWEKGHRIVDDDNLVASFKPARDEIAKFLGIDDRRFRVGEIVQDRDPNKGGYTVVTLREVE